MKNYYVYIITNYKRTTLYIGITNSIFHRIQEHKKGLTNGFSKRYSLKYLVYYEILPDIKSAIQREKILKKWNRAWKGELINKINPEWKDLSSDWVS